MLVAVLRPGGTEMGVGEGWGIQKLSLTPDGRHWVGKGSQPPRKLGEPPCAQGLGILWEGPVSP